MVFSNIHIYLTTIHHMTIQNPIIIDSLELFTKLYTTGETIFAWIPSHIGITEMIIQTMVLSSSFPGFQTFEYNHLFRKGIYFETSIINYIP